MTRSVSIVFFLFAVLLLAGCNKKVTDDRDFPGLRTNSVSAISGDGATFSGEIIERGEAPLISYGFLWSELSNPVLEKSEKRVLTGGPPSSVFSVRISTTLEEGVNYHVRAFLQTSEYIVYGNEVIFRSLGSKAPEIHSVEPESATLGDTLILRGRNFSYLTAENIARFDTNRSEVTYSSDTLLRVIVPFDLKMKNSVVSVEIAGNSAILSKQFMLTSPVIDSFTPAMAPEKDIITVFGREFCRYPQHNVVKFGETRAEVISVYTMQLTVRVPAVIDQPSVAVSLSVGGQETIAPARFILSPPLISGFSPTSSSIRQEVAVRGKNFGSSAANVRVYFGDQPSAITSYSDSLFNVQVPTGLPLTGVKLKLLKSGYEIFSGNTFSLVTPVAVAASPRKATSGNTVILSGSGFSPQGGDNKVTIAGIDAVIVYNSEKALHVKVPPGIIARNVRLEVSSGNYKTEPLDFEYVGGEWLKAGSFPGDKRDGMAGFVIDKRFFAGLGSFGPTFKRDFWSFDTETGLWKRLADFPGTPRVSPVAFTLNGKAYVGLGYYDYSYLNDFWEYDPAGDTWMRIGDFPGAARWEALSFTLDGKAFVGLGRTSTEAFSDFYSFSPDAGTWTRIADFPGRARASAAVFVIDAYAYAGIGGAKGGISSDKDYCDDFWKYDSGSDQWTRIPDFPVPGRVATASFTVAGRAYVAMGERTINHGITEYDSVYEYDPLTGSWAESTRNPFGTGYHPLCFNMPDRAWLMFPGRYAGNSPPVFEVFRPYN